MCQQFLNLDIAPLLCKNKTGELYRIQNTIYDIIMISDLFIMSQKGFHPHRTNLATIMDQRVGVANISKPMPTANDTFTYCY